MPPLSERQARRWRGVCWRYCRTHGIGGAVLDDLVQEMAMDKIRAPAVCFLDLGHSLRHALDRVNPRVRRHGQRLRRSRYEILGLLPDQSDPTPLPDVLLWQTLTRLPCWHGVGLGLLVYAHYVEGWTQREIALQMGVDAARISQLLAQALTRLRAWIEEDACA